MIDRKFGDHSRFLTAVGLRLDDARSAVLWLPRGAEARLEDPRRAWLLHPMQGDVLLKRHGFPDATIRAGQFAGVEKAPEGRVVNAAAEVPARVLVSSIGQRRAFIRRLPEDMLIVSRRDEPFWTVMERAAALLALVIEETAPDVAVTRRLCEILMLQILRFVQSRPFGHSQAPAAVRHDPYLLRAWTAFFSDPGGRWTIARLAEAAGLGRSAFIARFKAAFGAPPLETLTRMRMEQAQYLLRASDAPLAEIAEEVGYASEAAFVRAFARTIGTTPGAWRRGSFRG